MLEGLEVSEINLSYLFGTDNKASARMDAEFYKKEFVLDEELLLKLNSKPLSSLTKKIDVGYVGSMVEEYINSGVFLLQTKNIDEFFTNENDPKFISLDFHNELSKSKVQKKDILIARSGSFGKASIFLSDVEVNSSDIIIVQADENKINPFFLTTFLNSSLGVNQLIKFASGGLQGHVNLTILENLKIPVLSTSFQFAIEKTVLKAFEKLFNSKSLYSSAEYDLLNELGLGDWQPTIRNNNSKSFKESFLSSGRIDAEYYQPKYDELLQVLNKFKHDALGNLVTIQKSIEPGSDAYQNEGIPFIRVANLSKNGISESDVFLSKDEFGEFPVMPKKNTILLSKDGSVGIAYKVVEDMKAITSGAILHLNVSNKKVLPDYLTLVLNSVVVKLQAERDAGGSIIQHWKPDEIKQVIIPVIDDKIQEAISDKMQQSFALLTKSHQLLEAAKKAVEIAIEQDEKAALDYLKNN